MDVWVNRYYVLTFGSGGAVQIRILVTFDG